MSSILFYEESDLTGSHSKVTEDSILAIQIFDQKKFKKKDQGFLGVINVRVGDVMDLDVGGEGSIPIGLNRIQSLIQVVRNAHPRPQEIDRQLSRPR